MLFCSLKIDTREEPKRAKLGDRGKENATKGQRCAVDVTVDDLIQARTLLPLPHHAGQPLVGASLPSRSRCSGNGARYY